MMSPPPSQERRGGATPVMTLWQMKANTSSEALRLATRLGEITFRDMVSVAKAINPENAIPRNNKSSLRKGFRNISSVN